jgi:hypothetical protein
VNREQAENVCELTAHLMTRGQDLTPSVVARDALQIHKRARTLQRLAEVDCYRELAKTEIRIRERNERQIIKWVTSYGLTAKFGGDPRGYVVKIQGLPGNTWSGDSEGFGVG